MSRPVIAVVDDDPGMLAGIERLLRASGYQAEAFSSAEAFLDRGAASEPKCLILDINLGGISGIELQRQLNASGRKIPTVFITAVDDASIRREAMTAGCIAFLLKPFAARALTSAIEQAGN